MSSRSRIPAPQFWPEEVEAITYRSTADGTMQPALFYRPEGTAPVPLLVALHTWSGNHTQNEAFYARGAMAEGWAMIYPEFRGPNERPEACGSDLVVQDIIDAVDYARANATIDPERIYLVGVSGGGYAALLLAARAPHLWAGVSAWCGLSDLKAWHQECMARNVLNYADMIEKSCGGAPGSSSQVDEEYRKRSPLAYLEAAKNVSLDLQHGIHDGHQGSVPCSQFLHAYNFLAAPGERIPEEDVKFITEKAQVPAGYPARYVDPDGTKEEVVLRKISGRTRLTLFEGGHAIIPEAALGWLGAQRKGGLPVWTGFASSGSSSEAHVGALG